MSSTKTPESERLSPNIPIRYDYSEYIYDQDEIADTARTEASSARDYKFEHGRRYHAYREGSYPMPNDDLAIEHERMGHHMWGLVLNDKLFLPPLREPKNVIDLGTGIGLWAMDMADRYPDAKILGVDLTPPPEPLYPNLQFQVDDITEEWVNDAGYDLVHLRSLYGAIRDWPKLYSTIFENLLPGGWVQHIEIEIKPRCDDGTLPPDNILEHWVELATQMDQIGKSYHLTDQMKRRFETAGFVDITEYRKKLPLGPWSSNSTYQNLGYYFEMYWRTGSQGWLMGSLTREFGWTPSQVNEVVEKAFRLIDSRSAHVYYDAVIVYGRKP